MAIWLARDGNTVSGVKDSYYHTFQNKPVQVNDIYGDITFHPSYDYFGAKLGTYCPSIMHSLSNMKLKPGTMVRIKAIKFIL